MLKSSKNIIILFSVLFLTLVAIQIYFLYKTYKIKERQNYDFIIKTIENYQDNLKQKFGLREDSVQENFVLFRAGKLSEQEFRKNIEKLNQKSISEYSKLIDSIFTPYHFDVATRYDINNAISVNDKRYLFTKPITVYETYNKVKKPGKIEEGLWETSSSTVDTDINNGKPVLSAFKTRTSHYYEIKNIQSIVFKDLWILVLCCILLLASVLWLFVLTIRNLISQQKQVEVLHTVVDNIAHEFKTPVATLKIAAKALKKDWNQENLPLIERQINRLESLMLQLHDSENYENIPTSHDDWNHYIEDLKFAYPQTQFTIQNTTPKSLPFSKTDTETLVKNICENSAKYGSSLIDIEISAMQNNLKLKISDNGNGISKKEQQHIFEKFYRIQSNNIHNTKGLGLGLFLVKNIVEKYNGKIELQSEMSKGTTFNIILPYEN
ncbi:HAMP domain-containing histidine kinase [Elizabethkingia meningoseptica]|uniref:sensor histidine kinase n=1 Tax=Elizabethkingia meningoseptica TaxID=238 RepID=UPI00099994D1|nr:HAMP domain-containing sensor histidine kinase [Elizabethkingia meningoseptica]MCL1677360.1 HAMP domain-containing histidine kinase [Elizabethkingia meningoseptica]MCL1688065.1 HAMP domain-containing histidine kinase [Elizabethkingia meningoseptica]MDE5431370.1 HAMP domain-containing histidine kinase [Elizabethkingia meningoseptica]MDE5437915.1 HAMP domain-containing histidine kinase [Elizabethkingia meningoseptica]MDE5493640.1 HAMP domain-containing histidine kinase [Elizabethkingia mening